jgi:eukaryotic-like serine/threonine-protein kinase
MYAGAEAEIRICAVCRASYRDPNLRVCPRDGGALTVWAEDPLLGGVLGDRYQVVEPLGQGGMGSVYLAERLPDELEVAIKIVRPEHMKNSTVQERFLREVRHTSSVRSPHVVAILDSGMSPDGRAYMVMERLVGESLTERMRRSPALTPLEALQVARDVARALAAAHAANVIHRDLKPDNIFLCSDGAVKVVDFGIAKALVPEKAKASEPSLTEAHRVVGTPVYMAPEVITKAGLYPQSDLYALGVILYETLVGEPPFYEMDAVGTMYRHLHDTPRRLREVDASLAIPGGVETLVRDLLAKRPGERPPGAGPVVERLDALIGLLREQPVVRASDPGGLTAVWRPIAGGALPPIAEDEPTGGGRRWLIIGLAAVLALMVGFAATAAVIYFLGPRPGTVQLP